MKSGIGLRLKCKFMIIVGKIIAADRNTNTITLECYKPIDGIAIGDKFTLNNNTYVPSPDDIREMLIRRGVMDKDGNLTKQ